MENDPIRDLSLTAQLAQLKNDLEVLRVGVQQPINPRVSFDVFITILQDRIDHIIQEMKNDQ